MKKEKIATKKDMMKMEKKIKKEDKKQDASMCKGKKKK